MKTYHVIHNAGEMIMAQQKEVTCTECKGKREFEQVDGDTIPCEVCAGTGLIYEQVACKVS